MIVYRKVSKCKFTPLSSSSDISVNNFAECVHNVREFLTKNTKLVTQLGNLEALQQVPLVKIIAKTVQVVESRKEQCGYSRDNEYCVEYETATHATEPESSVASEGENEVEEERNRVGSAKSQHK